MKSEISIKVLSLDDGDGFIHFEIIISNGKTRAELDFYDYSDSFKTFGENLIEFPQKVTDRFEFRNGEDDARWANFLLLQVFCYEPSGLTAIKVIVDNHSSEPYFERSEFFIRTEPVFINRWGQGLKNWNPNEEFEFNWKD